MKTDEARDEFAREFLKIQALFELLYPDVSLRPIRDSYSWLAKVYESIQPAMASDALLWHRLGAKTLQLINEHVLTVDVRGAGVETVTIDEETLKALRELEVPGGTDNETPDVEQILDSIERRIQKRLAEKNSPAYRSLAERLEKLRDSRMGTASDSIEFLKRLLETARDLIKVEREEAEAAEGGGAVDEKPESVLPEQHIGALTQIFEEYRPDTAPDIIERVVKEIDEVVRQVRFTNWQKSYEGSREVRRAIRQALRKYGLAHEHELFDRAYEYVEQSY